MHLSLHSANQALSTFALFTYKYHIFDDWKIQLSCILYLGVYTPPPPLALMEYCGNNCTHLWMEPYLEPSPLIGDLDNIPPLDVVVRFVIILLVIHGNTLAAVANGNDTPICVFSQELVLSITRQLLGDFKEFVISLSSRVANVGLVCCYDLSLIVIRLCTCECVCVCVCEWVSEWERVCEGRAEGGGRSLQ